MNRNPYVITKKEVVIAFGLGVAWGCLTLYVFAPIAALLYR